ncbi:MAG: MFS transporter [Janthinobacterium lividum]
MSNRPDELAGKPGSTSIPVSPLYAKIAWRILPLVMVYYLFAYLDRVNVGFAKLQMLNDLKFSEAAYGLGAGLFFIGYLVFEVPSNIYMMRVGARKTLCRIMMLWGAISMAFAFVQTPMQFYIMRILLGAAEAGFFPGIILYLTFWFPSNTRAKMTALFYSALPISGLLGSPVSGWILDHMHAVHGLSGWQWLFLIEGLPSLLIGMAIPWIMCDAPRDAKWLSEAEKRQVIDDLEADVLRKNASSGGALTIAGAFSKPRVWHLVAICVSQAIGVYGIAFWLPTMLKEIGYTTPAQIGLISMVPFATATIVLNLVCRSSDRRLERRWHTAVPFVLTALALLASTQLGHNPLLALIALSIATAGAYATSTMFWTLPSLFFSGISMAAAIGLLNSVGGLGGFISPYAVGLVKNATGTTTYGVYMIAAVLVVGALLVLRLPKDIVNR